MCVLIVEDEWINLLGAAMVLENEGHDVMTAGDGPEAIKHIERHPEHFRCLVTDYNMPNGMTGADLIVCMRKVYPSIPMVITTAGVGVVTEEWRERYAVHMLPKPYDPSALAEIVERLLAEAKGENAAF